MVQTRRHRFLLRLVYWAILILALLCVWLLAVLAQAALSGSY